MRNHKKYTPYIRRYHPGDRCTKYIDQIKFKAAVGATHYVGGKLYVMVQRGWSRDVVAWGWSRHHIQSFQLWYAVNRRYGATWRDYQRLVHAHCLGSTLPLYTRRWNSGVYGLSNKANGLARKHRCQRSSQTAFNAC